MIDITITQARLYPQTLQCGGWILPGNITMLLQGHLWALCWASRYDDKRRKSELPDLAVQTPRDCQIGIVAEHSPRCSCFNYTFHTGPLHIVLLVSIDIYLKMLYINFCNILVVPGDGIVRLHPILDDLGCILTHIKWMKHFQCADTIYLLKINSYIWYNTL